MNGLQQRFVAELQRADDAQKSIQAALGRQQVRCSCAMMPRAWFAHLLRFTLFLALTRVGAEPA